MCSFYPFFLASRNFHRHNLQPIDLRVEETSTETNSVVMKRCGKMRNNWGHHTQQLILGPRVPKLWKHFEGRLKPYPECILMIYVFVLVWVHDAIVDDHDGQGYPTGSLVLQRQDFEHAFLNGRFDLKEEILWCLRSTADSKVGDEHNGWVWLGDAWHVKAIAEPTRTAYMTRQTAWRASCVMRQADHVQHPPKT